MKNDELDRQLAVQKAVDFILKKISDGTIAPGKYLPSIASLSTHAGVSRFTMWRAVNVLKQRGILKGEKRHRIRVIQSSEDAAGDGSYNADNEEPQDLYHKPLWERTKERIAQNIFEGVWGIGQTLPMQKELARMLNVSYRTLRKALSSLEADKTITPHKRGYAVPSLVEFPSRSATIVFILPGDKERNKAVFSGPDEQFLRILELECIHSGIHLDVAYFFPEDEDLKFFDTKSGLSYSISGNESIIGYVLAETNVSYEVLSQILRRLSHAKRRVAILTHKVPLNVPRQIAIPSLFGFFALGATEKPGKHVAQYLLSKGHKKVAYITPYHLGVWSQNRLDGMRKAFAMAGFSDAVHLLDIGGRIEELFAKQAYKRCNFDKLRKQYEAWRNNAPPEYRYGFDAGFEALATAHAAQAEMYYQLSAEFAQLIKDKSITAWVASNDQVAMMILYYLRNAGIEVPGRMSVVGFDNTNMALEANLTSYDFNTPGIARSTLHFILRTNRFFSNRRSTVIDIDGHVIERKTVANLS